MEQGPPPRRAEPALAAYPMQPLDSSIAGMYDFEPGGPVNFYEDDGSEDDEPQTTTVPHPMMVPHPLPQEPVMVQQRHAPQARAAGHASGGRRAAQDGPRAFSADSEGDAVAAPVRAPVRTVHRDRCDVWMRGGRRTK